jgi:hypothetical protein
MKLHSNPIAEKGFEQLQIDFAKPQSFVQSPSGLLHGIVHSAYASQIVVHE